MTDWKYIACVAFLGIFFANGFYRSEAKTLLGAKECTWGPSYWCSNLTNAKNCRAVPHCIQAVWEKQVLPFDDDDVCKICVDMVKQARDQLESNETQTDLKAVFDGSCKLIPLKVVSEECMKLVDEFVPELVETLASEMNPQVVCAVAGLCNSERIDKMLVEYKSHTTTPPPTDVSVENAAMCDGCHLVATKMKENFDSLTYDEFLEKLIRQCGKLGSFSDSCSAIVFSHFEDIYNHMKRDFNADNVCHLVGTCSERFHQHEEGQVAVEITPFGDSGKIIGESDDLPCSFCEKLVSHLRDILIANTTDLEFKRVLEGICSQTGTFADECHSLVDQYYDEIYNYLISELDPEGVCFIAGICKKGGVAETGPIAPLLPHELVVKVFKPASDQQLIGTDEANSYKPVAHISVPKNDANVKVIQPEIAQLPIERMFVPAPMPQGKTACTFCQYFLHYLQVEISEAGNEEEIKTAVESACDKLPSVVEQDCKSFVEAYGNQVIALLVQKIDPATVCPKIKLCPNPEVKDVEIQMVGAASDKPNCPLCLFAVQQLESIIENNKTEESIEKALDSLCNHLSVKLRGECNAFVDSYYKELVEMMVADFTPQQVCVFLKLCKDSMPATPLQTIVEKYHSHKGLMADHNNFRKPMLPKEMLSNDLNGDIETNEIPDNTINGVPIVNQQSTQVMLGTPQCIICEWVITKLDSMLSSNKTDEEIKEAVKDVCSIMPKNITRKCDDFINKYADVVIMLITKELTPHQICDIMALCTRVDMKDSVLDCVVCEESVYVIEKILDNPKVDHQIEHIIEKTCNAVPAKYYDRCTKLISTYGESIIHLLVNLPNSRSVCGKIGLCGDSEGPYVGLTAERREKRSQHRLGEKKCTWGPSYWCSTLDNAHECNALQHCKERVWLAEEPPKKN